MSSIPRHSTWAASRCTSHKIDCRFNCSKASITRQPQSKHTRHPEISGRSWELPLRTTTSSLPTTTKPTATKYLCLSNLITTKRQRSKIKKWTSSKKIMHQIMIRRNILHRPRQLEGLRPQRMVRWGTRPSFLTLMSTLNESWTPRPFFNSTSKPFLRISERVLNQLHPLSTGQ